MRGCLVESLDSGVLNQMTSLCNLERSYVMSERDSLIDEIAAYTPIVKMQQEALANAVLRQLKGKFRAEVSLWDIDTGEADPPPTLHGEGTTPFLALKALAGSLRHYYLGDYSLAESLMSNAKISFDLGTVRN